MPEPRGIQTRKKKSGVYFFDAEVLQELLREQGLSAHEFKKKLLMEDKTKDKVIRGMGVQDAIVDKVLNVLGVETRTGLVFAEGEDRESHFSPALRRSGIQEWEVEPPLTPVLTTTNGLQYRVYRLKHRHQQERLGRGKRYEFWHLSDDAKSTLRELLIRHPKVCDRVGPHPQIPLCYGTFPEPDAKAWWVIDRWTEGKSLREILTSQSPFATDELRRLARETATGLCALHRAGIIRRELSPDGILVADESGQTLLTDFELAKLLDGSPSVSRDWPANPYRAPEVGEAIIDEQADIFSWGRVVIHAAIGNLPAVGTEADSLAKVKLPTGIRSLLISSVKPRKSQRPASMADVLTIVERWK